jgi:glycosyltransferase involved in cell wall biosynthesis
MHISSERILFLTSSAFNNVTGGGITFSNLFNGWPAENIATIHNDSIPVSCSVCNKYFNLTSREIYRWGFFKYISLSETPIEISPKASFSIISRRKISLLRKVKNLFFGDGIPRTTCLSDELVKWVSCFRPTVLYTILGSNEMMELADKLRIKFNLPLVVHMMDDWPSVIYRGGILSFFQRHKKDRLLSRLMKVAVLRFAICKDMADVYEVRYKRPFQWFQNTIDTRACHQTVKNSSIVSKPVRVAYIGSILPNVQLESLIDCCNAIQSLDDEGFSIQIEIYSSSDLIHVSEQYRERLALGGAISLKGAIVDNEVFFRTMQDVDILILPVNFNSYTIKYIRYSMPTKIPAYLASGTPILVYGPIETAQISYAAKEGWGLPVIERNMNILKMAIKKLSTDTNLRSELSSRAQLIALMNHDSSIVRKKFQESFSSVRYP